jgi:hypothetical protein
MGKAAYFIHHVDVIFFGQQLHCQHQPHLPYYRPSYTASARSCSLAPKVETWLQNM